MNYNRLNLLIVLVFALFVNTYAHKNDSTKLKWRYLDDQNIKIKMPLFFERGEGFNGYIHKNSGTSIVFHQYKNYSYRLYHAGYISQSDYHNSSSTTLTGIDTVKIGRIKGYMYHFNFAPEEAKIMFKRKLFITGDLNNTMLIMINYPESMEEELYEYFIKSLKTIRITR